MYGECSNSGALSLVSRTNSETSAESILGFDPESVEEKRDCVSLPIEVAAKVLMAYCRDLIPSLY